MAAFGDLLVTTRQARVGSPQPTPGFAAPRHGPTASTASRASPVSTPGAARPELDEQRVTVIGNSIGGWIAAEMGLLASPRISGVILVDAVGIEVAGHPVADFFALTLDQVAQFSYHDPDRFRIDPASMSDAQRAVVAGNRASLADVRRAAR